MKKELTKRDRAKLTLRLVIKSYVLTLLGRKTRKLSIKDFSDMCRVVGWKAEGEDTMYSVVEEENMCILNTDARQGIIFFRYNNGNPLVYITVDEEMQNKYKSSINMTKRLFSSIYDRYMVYGGDTGDDFYRVEMYSSALDYLSKLCYSDTDRVLH